MPDVFISYAHLDNETAGGGTEGWVERFHKSLSHKVQTYRGRSPEIWRDLQIDRTGELRDEVFDALNRAAVLVPILSPSYMNSMWCTSELDKFATAARAQDGEGTKNRIFKVVKIPIGTDEPTVVKERLGYEFFERVENRSRFGFRTIDPNFGDGHLQKFLQKIDDLARDICEKLESIVTESKATVYLSRPTAGLDSRYHAVKRELRAQGYAVVPDKPLPVSDGDFRVAVDDWLKQSRLSIHMFGRHDARQARLDETVHFGNQIRPQEEYELANEVCVAGEIRNLIWIARDQEFDTEDQEQFAETLRSVNLPDLSELTDVGFESLKEVIRQKLKELEAEPGEIEDATEYEDSDHSSVYVLCHPCDVDAAHLCDLLSDLEAAELVVHTPSFDDDPATIDERHKQHQAWLQTCDGIVVFSNQSKKIWLDTQKSEIIASRRLKRPDAPELLYYIAPPIPPDKKLFRHSEVVKASESYAKADVEAFIRRIRARSNAQ